MAASVADRQKRERLASSPGSLCTADGGKSGSMKRYVNGIIGGILAILAAFGWTITLGVVLASRDNMIVGIHITNRAALGVVLFSIFSAGFYLGFRKVYYSRSK